MFTTTDLLAAASSTLDANGYQLIPAQRLGMWPGAGFHVYENPYSVVAVVVFETWAELSSNWLEAQVALVELMSTHFTRDEAKAWDAYLLLLTPSILPSEALTEARDIRSNTSHVRKLVATGEELSNVGDVERALLPLLPLPEETQVMDEGSALDFLPELISSHGISERVGRALIAAFREQQPMVERLHDLRNEEPN